MRSGAHSRRAAGASPGSSSRAPSSFRLDNPYWHDDPAMFARGYVRSVTAWGGPLLLRAFAREGEDRAPVSWPTSSESSRSASRMPPTATAGTTSRPSSSAGRPTARGATGRAHELANGLRTRVLRLCGHMVANGEDRARRAHESHGITGMARLLLLIATYAADAPRRSWPKPCVDVS